jgi:uroporphyrin-III C-methyltransferase/precorrin-2 dehydrogenase/sirohydrochlorin ferrochelatase
MRLHAEDGYLLALRLAGRRVVVAGGGAVAARRVPALLDAGAEVAVIAPELSPALHDLAAAGRITWAARGYAGGDCSGAWLVCACTDDPAVNAAVAAEADAAGIWCVRADDAAASRAWTPASGQAGDVRVGVLSGDPRRSAGIRDELVGALSSGAIGARSGSRGGRRGSVALVGGGPGDPGLITVRGRALLAQADVVVADRLAPRSLLDELPADVEIVDAAKIPRGRAMAQEYINSVLVSRATAGRFVVRLKGGDPFVFGRGAEEVLACLRAGLPVTVVPGVSSAIAAPTVAGVPLTHRGVVQEFHVISAHVPPGDERSTVNWAALGSSRATLVLLMATEHLTAKSRIFCASNDRLPYPCGGVGRAPLGPSRPTPARDEVSVARRLADAPRPGVQPRLSPELTRLLVDGVEDELRGGSAACRGLRAAHSGGGRDRRR